MVIGVALSLSLSLSLLSLSGISLALLISNSNRFHQIIKSNFYANITADLFCILNFTISLMIVFFCKILLRSKLSYWKKLEWLNLTMSSKKETD